MTKLQMGFALLIVLITACSENKQPAATEVNQDSIADDAATDSVLPGAAKADSYYYNIDPAEIPAAVKALVPAGYEGLDTATGELNGDEYNDLIVVLRKANELNEYDWMKDPKKRPLLIFVALSDSSYKLAARNDNAVLCYHCAGSGHQADAYEKLVIKNGFFSIEQQTGARTETVSHITTFKYSPADSTWLLHRDGTEINTMDNDGSYQKKSTTIRTSRDFGKIKFEEYDIYKDQ